MTDFSYEHYETDHEIGQDNIEVLGMDVHNPVFMQATRRNPLPLIARPYR